MRVQRDEGLWTAKETKEGTSISKTRISEKQYNAGIKVLNTLDKSEMNEAYKKELENK